MYFVYFFATVLLFATLFKFILQKKITIPTSGAVNALAIFLIIQAISTIFSTDKFTSIFGYPTRLNGGLLSLFAYFVIFISAQINLDRQKAINIILAAFFASVAVAIWGIPSYFRYDPSCYVLTGKLTSSCWQKEFNPTLRIFSTLGQPNWLASYLVLTLPLTLPLLLGAKKQIQKIIIITSGALIFMAIILTTSRAGILGTAIAIVIVFALTKLKTIKNQLPALVALAITFVLITLIFGTKLTSRINEATKTAPKNSAGQSSSAPTKSALASGGTDSGQIRLIVWEGAINIFKRWPLLGAGPETFVNTYYLYRPLSHNNTTEWEFFYNKAHNEFLNYLANTGILGLGSYLAFITLAALALFKSRSENFSASIIASSLGYFATIFFGFSTVATQTIFFSLLACGLVMAKNKTSTKTYSLPYLNNRAFFTLAALTISLLGVYCLTFFARLYFADTTTRRAQNSLSAKSILNYDNANTLTPVENPYLMADFAYALGVYQDKIDNTDDKNRLAAQADLYAKKSTGIAPNNYLITQKAVKTYILIAGAKQEYTKNTLNFGNKLTQLAPTYPTSFLLLTKTQITLGDNTAALASINKALSLKPDYPEAQQLLEELGVKPIQ